MKTIMERIENTICKVKSPTNTIKTRQFEIRLSRKDGEELEKIIKLKAKQQISHIEPVSICGIACFLVPSAFDNLYDKDCYEVSYLSHKVSRNKYII